MYVVVGNISLFLTNEVFMTDSPRNSFSSKDSLSRGYSFLEFYDLEVDRLSRSGSFSSIDPEHIKAETATTQIAQKRFNANEENRDWIQVGHSKTETAKLWGKRITFLPGIAVAIAVGVAALPVLGIYKLTKAALKATGIIKKSIKVSQFPNERSDKNASLLTAYITCRNNAENNNIDKDKEQEYFRKIGIQTTRLNSPEVQNNPGEIRKIEKKIEDLYKECAVKVAGVSEKDFKVAYDIARGLQAPAVVKNVLEQGTEKTTRHDHSSSLSYLEQRNEQNPKFEAQIRFMTKNPDFTRVSELKGNEETQGIPTNAHLHTFEKPDGTTASVFRSGAFAVHGRHKTRVDELKKESTKLINKRKSNEDEINKLKEKNDELMQELNTISQSKKSTEQIEDQAQGTPDVRISRKQAEISANSLRIGELKAEIAKITQIDQQIKGVHKAKHLGLDGLQKKLKEFEKLEKVLKEDLSNEAELQGQVDDMNAVSQWTGEEEMTIDKLKAIKKAEFSKKLRLELGFADLDELRAEISTRRDFCIAQALPEIMASVKLSAEDPEALYIAIKTGSFLHVAEGMLSHLNPAERGMIQDMKATLDYLSEHCTIQFVDDPTKEGVVVDNNDPLNPQITLNLKKTNIFFGDRTKFGLTAIYTNTAVNEVHTFRQLFGSVSPGMGEYRSIENYQNEINKQALEKLENRHKVYSLNRNDKEFRSKIEKSIVVIEHSLSGYEEEIDHLKDGEETTASIKKIQENDYVDFKEHYSSEGSRTTKDLEGMTVVERLTNALGGQIGIKCKSGKDRTSIGVANYFTKDVPEIKDKKDLKKGLLGGISHYLTGVNTGKPRGFAFNAFQRLFVKDSPPSDLCTSCNS